MSHNNSLFRRLINKLFVKSAGGENRPTLISPRDVFPEFIKIEQHYTALKNEINAIIADRQLVEYGKIDPPRSSEVSKRWKLYYAYFLHKVNPLALEQCPTLIEIVRKMPNVINASIAVLEPGVELAPHCGPHAGILRYHLGIRVPSSNPPSLRVKDDWYTWAEGKSIVLDDFFEHEVINKSKDIRVILMIDFYRPLPSLLQCINKFSVWLDRHWAKHFIHKVNTLK